jgi:hypothetical protein
MDFTSSMYFSLAASPSFAPYSKAFVLGAMTKVPNENAPSLLRKSLRLSDGPAMLATVEHMPCTGFVLRLRDVVDVKKPWENSAKAKKAASTNIGDRSILDFVYEGRCRPAPTAGDRKFHAREFDSKIFELRASFDYFAPGRVFCSSNIVKTIFTCRRPSRRC